MADSDYVLISKRDYDKYLINGARSNTGGESTDSVCVAVSVVGTNGVVADVDDLGHLSVIPHAHQEGGHTLIQLSSASVGDYIVIDISDTTNYPHDNTTWIHFGNLVMDVNAANNATYSLELGFIENLTSTTGDYHPIYRWNGTKSDNNINQVIATNPENVKARASSNASTGVLVANAAFGTGVSSVGDTRNVASAINFGNGDIVLRVLASTGAWDMALGIVYHSH